MNKRFLALAILIWLNESIYQLSRYESGGWSASSSRPDIGYRPPLFSVLRISLISNAVLFCCCPLLRAGSVPEINLAKQPATSYNPA